jgi:hypothetical protein
MAVHDIHMEEGGAPSHSLLGILGQAGEISRQYGRRYLDQDQTSLASIWSNFSTGAGRAVCALRDALRLAEALDARPYFFVGEILAALQLGFTELHGFEKARLFFQIAGNRFLRQLRRLLGVEMYFHGQRLEVDNSACQAWAGGAPP